MWDGENKKRLQAPWPYPTSIAALAFSPTGAILAVASSYTFEEGEKEHPPDKVRCCGFIGSQGKYGFIGSHGTYDASSSMMTPHHRLLPCGGRGKYRCGDDDDDDCTPPAAVSFVTMLLTMLLTRIPSVLLISGSRNAPANVAHSVLAVLYAGLFPPYVGNRSQASSQDGPVSCRSWS